MFLDYRAAKSKLTGKSFKYFLPGHNEMEVLLPAKSLHESYPENDLVPTNVTTVVDIRLFCVLLSLLIGL